MTGNLENLVQELQTLLSTKTEFLQIASHQLRTPVTVMRNALDMLRERNSTLPPTKQQELLEHAYQKSVKLNEIIDDILAAAEMDIPNFDLSATLEPVNLATMAEKVLADHREEARTKGLEISLKKPDVVVPVSGSEVYLPQAIAQLIANAITYTPQGSITVHISHAGDRVVFAVKDTGIGVPSGTLPKLWAKFQRAENAKDLHTDGSGLGLFIVKKIVEGHPGGKVFAESTLNQGSTFGFSLPALQTTQP